MKVKDAIAELQKQDPEAEIGRFIPEGTILGDDYFSRRMEIGTVTIVLVSVIIYFANRIQIIWI